MASYTGRAGGQLRDKPARARYGRRIWQIMIPIERMADQRETPSTSLPRDLWDALRGTGEFCLYLALRFYRDRNFTAASSLSYTTLLAVVPLAAIGFGMLAAFSVFDEIREDLLTFVLKTFLPQNVDAVRAQFDLFLKNTRELTALGTVALAVTAVILLDTVDTWFNNIWRQPEVRPLVPRMLMYWAILTATPFLAGGSVALSTLIFAKTNLGAVQGSWIESSAVRLLPTILLFAAFAVSYMVIPYRKVRLVYAGMGAVVAALLYELLKWGFTLYFRAFPSYQTLYGALSVVPLLLVWMYLVWCAILFGAQTAAALPEWLALRRHGLTTDTRTTRRLAQALVMLQGLFKAGETGRPVDTETLMAPLSDSADTLEPMLEKLEADHYIARSNEDAWVLSRDPATITLYDLARDLGVTINQGLGDLRHLGPWIARLDDRIARTETAQQEAMNISLRDLFLEAQE